MKTAFVLVALFASFQARSADLRYSAKVYEPDSNRTKLLYNYRSESEVIGETVVLNNRFTYPDGRAATHEEITFTKDGHVTKYHQDQAQLNASGSIEISGGKAKFTWKKDGKEKAGSEDVGADFIVGSQIPMELETHWAEIMKGDTLKRRLAILERLESVGFSYSKEGEGDVDGKKSIIVKMKPTSFLIAAVVNPLHFYMSTDGKVLYEIKGRATVKKDLGNGKFTDLDAEIVYTKGPAPDIVPQPTATQPTGGNSK